MGITPTPAFMEAVRQVLDIKQLIPAPDVVLPALRDSVLGPKIWTAHHRIKATRLCQIADEQAAILQQQLDGGLTPTEAGYPHMAPAELVASEWKSWFEEENRIIAHAGHVDPSDSGSPYRLPADRAPTNV